MPTPLPTAAARNFSLRDVVDVIFRRKTQIVATFVVCVAAVVAISLLMTPQYEAEAQILIKVGRENLVMSAFSQDSPILTRDREEQINSEVQILNSRYLALQVIDAIGLRKIYPELERMRAGIRDLLFPRAEPLDREAAMRAAALQKFQRTLKVEPIRRSSVIAVRFRHPDPKMAAEVLNTLNNLFLEQHLRVYQSSQAYDFFNEQSRFFDRELRSAEDKLQLFKSRHGISSPDEQRTLLLKQEADLQMIYNVTKAKEVEIAGRIALLRQQLGSSSPTVTLDEETEVNQQTLNTLQARLIELELKARELGEQAPQANIQEQIALTRKKLQDEEAKRYKRSRVGLNEVFQKLQQDLLANEAELEATRAKGEVEASQLAEFRQRLAELNRLEVDFVRMKEDVEMARRNFGLYLTKREESRVSQAMDAERIANVSVIDPAQPSPKPVTPKLKLNTLLAMMLGLFAGFGVAFLRESFDKRIHTPDVLEHEIAIPVLASVPVLSLSDFPDRVISKVRDVEDSLRMPILATVPRLA